MLGLLHPYEVQRAVRCGLRWRLKRFLRIPDRPESPVVHGDATVAFERHLGICRLVAKSIAEVIPERRQVACEIGSGDCLAVADLILGAGFERIYLVEKKPIIIDQRQEAILTQLSEVPELPNRLDVFERESSTTLSPDRVKVIPEFFEFSNLPEKADFIFSHDVVEHVEDLNSFFKHCAKLLRPGGLMVHKFDLSGHEFFEDPMPPLDFQTYPDRLYALMFPRYRRACRWFLDEVTAATSRHGFSSISLTLIRTADFEYVNRIRPFLRTKARQRTNDELAPLDVVMTARMAV